MGCFLSGVASRGDGLASWRGLCVGSRNVFFFICVVALSDGRDGIWNFLKMSAFFGGCIFYGIKFENVKLIYIIFVHDG